MTSKIKDFQPIIVALIIAFSIIFSSMFIMGGVIKYQKMQNQSITVTGSASENVTSDFAVLTIGYEVQTPTLKAGYKQMKDSQEKIKSYLKKAGLDEKDINYSQITSFEKYKKVGNFQTNTVEFYCLNSNLTVSSKNIELISSLSNRMDQLVNMDVQISHSNVEYFVSNIDDIKIKMVGEATKNAKKRAESMVKSTGSKIGTINSAKMGVFQIVPVNSTDISDYGINDTGSVEKKVVAVVNATFTVK